MVSTVVGRVTAVAACVAGIVLALPAAAYAHGIGGGPQTVTDFVWSGFTHMITGWDHLLFIAGVVLLAGEWRRAAKLISLFALGHSTTLIVATLAEWQVSATAVDVVIALSVVFVGVVGWFGRPKKWTWFAFAVAGFGLIHGLGLSTRLQGLGLPEDGLLARVIAFNIGVEIGQLMAVLSLFMIGDVLRHYLGRARDGRLVGWLRSGRAAHAGLVAAGTIAAAILAVGAVTVEDEQPAQAAATGPCQIRERTESFKGIGGHPEKKFYEPTEQTPQDDFGHVMADAFIVLQYRPDLPAAQVDELRAFVSGPSGNKVVAGPAPEQTEAFKAIHMFNTLSCGEKVDAAALLEFKKSWVADPRSRAG